MNSLPHQMGTPNINSKFLSERDDSQFKRSNNQGTNDLLSLTTDNANQSFTLGTIIDPVPEEEQD